MGVAEVSAIAASVSAGVAVLGGIVSVVAWVRARSERSTAAEQARIATEAAAGADKSLRQIADLQAKQHERAEARESAEEREPWSAHRIPGNGVDAELRNTTGTPKYGITVEVFAGSQPFGMTTNIDYIGPNQGKPFGFVDVNAPMTARVTWHLHEDQSGSRPPQTINMG
jgi:hypothetical protein